MRSQSYLEFAKGPKGFNAIFSIMSHIRKYNVDDNGINRKSNHFYETFSVLPPVL